MTESQLAAIMPARRSYSELVEENEGGPAYRSFNEGRPAHPSLGEGRFIDIVR